MNQMLGNQVWAALSGLAAEHDFVEAPSQMLEEWMKDPSVLQRFAKHCQTEQTIPSALLEALVRADRIGRASNERAQIWFSDFALKLHSADIGTTDPERLWKQTYHHFFQALEDPEEHGYVQFVHWIYYTSNYYT